MSPSPITSERIFSWFGILALIQSIVNPATIGPIVFFVGLQINEETLNFLPPRHYAAYIIGLFPSVYDWTTNVANASPLADDTFSYDVNSAGSPGWIGVLAWKRGSLLVSLLWTSIVVQAIDRQWKLATIWALIASLFAAFGIIHVPTAGFSNWDSPFWEQCTAPDTCWDFANQWMFFVAYLMLAATFTLIWIAAKFDEKFEDPIDDESRHAFDDWFKDAANVTDADGHVVERRVSVPETVHKEEAEMEEAPPPVAVPSDGESEKGDP